MKIQNVINLVKCHVEDNDLGFRSEVSRIASDFDKEGKTDIANYLMELISTAGFYVPQNTSSDFMFLRKSEIQNQSLFLPEAILDDILGIVRSSNKKISISKILFYGKPGSGKTQSAYQIARLLNRDLFLVNMEDLVDSHLGQTPKNIVALFAEIRRLYTNKVVVLFDEIDSLVMNRRVNNDVREMGRVVSTFLKELENVSDQILIIATTNLMDTLDAALLRRFEAKISFDRYKKEDLIQVADAILASLLKKTETDKSDVRLFNKILATAPNIPFPGDLRQLIKISLAFADESNEYDYLRRFYMEVHHAEEVSIQDLTAKGFTTREIGILTGISKSSVSRKQKEAE